MAKTLFTGRSHKNLVILICPLATFVTASCALESLGLSLAISLYAEQNKKYLREV